MPAERGSGGVVVDTTFVGREVGVDRERSSGGPILDHILLDRLDGAQVVCTARLPLVGVVFRFVLALGALGEAARGRAFSRRTLRVLRRGCHMVGTRFQGVRGTCISLSDVVVAPARDDALAGEPFP